MSAIDLTKATKIPVSGGCPKEDLLWLAKAARDKTTILELGSFHGRSARAMLDNSEATLWCVDSWTGIENPGPDHAVITEDDFFTFLRNTSDLHHRMVILRMFTRQAAEVLDGLRFDMIFIDANHTYEAVKFDVTTFMPMVSPGGILCGHDYNINYPGCMKAVRELVPNKQIGGANIWWTKLEG